MIRLKLLGMPTYNLKTFGMSSNSRYTGSMATEDDSRWMTAWLMLVRTHTRFWDRIEAQMRREHGLTMARYDVLAHLNMAGGRLGLSELASAIALSPSGL